MLVVWFHSSRSSWMHYHYASVRLSNPKTWNPSWAVVLLKKRWSRSARWWWRRRRRWRKKWWWSRQQEILISCMRKWFSSIAIFSSFSLTAVCGSLTVCVDGWSNSFFIFHIPALHLIVRKENPWPKISTGDEGTEYDVAGEREKKRRERKQLNNITDLIIIFSLMLFSDVCAYGCYLFFSLSCSCRRLAVMTAWLWILMILFILQAVFTDFKKC